MQIRPPVQLLVIRHPGSQPHDALRAELQRLRSTPGIRLPDLDHVRKHADGQVERLELSDLTPDAAVDLGALVGELIGVVMDGESGAEQEAMTDALAAQEGASVGQQLWYADDAIPPGSAATVAAKDAQRELRV